MSEINQNQECGLRVEDRTIEFQAGDIVTCFSKRWIFYSAAKKNITLSGSNPASAPGIQASELQESLTLRGSL